MDVDAAAVIRDDPPALREPKTQPASRFALVGVFVAKFADGVRVAVTGASESGVFRWSEEPIPFDRPGVWLPREHESVLPWLKPFNGDVLVGFEHGEIAAGVGRKLHDRWGHELAVVTENNHRGRGWAKRLVSQAAERVLDDGAVPTYLHSPTNEASARTADACGFPDRGWRILGIFPSDPGR